MSGPTITDLYRVVYDMAPETLTHEANLDGDWGLKLRFRLKLAGWNYRDDAHIVKLLTCATKRGVLRQEGQCFARWNRP